MQINHFQPPQAPLESPLPAPIDPFCERDFFQAWVLLVLFGGLGGGIAGFVIGTLGSAAMAAAGLPMAPVKLWVQIAAGCAGLAISYFVFRHLVKALFAERVAFFLSQRDSATPGTPRHSHANPAP